ncbi:MAG TPA: Calx-beta domain-containing protein [Parafilimonas sp.]|nr:Calx-beta domain-containing protein [Parafilimonas sp.]
MKNFYTACLCFFIGLSITANNYAQCPSVTLSGGACTGNDITAGLPLAPASLRWKKDGVLIKEDAPAWNQAPLIVAGGNGQGSGDNQLDNSYIGIKADAQGNIYITDQNNHRVQKWAPGATSGVTVAGGNGYGTDESHLNYPRGICFDAQGNLYIADNGNNRVIKWVAGASGGVTVAGGNGQGDGANQLNYPSFVQMDAAGNLYVMDYVYQNYGYARVTKWAPGATEGMLVAGGGVYGDPSALDYPNGMCTDKDGNIYVARGNSFDVVKWAPGASAPVRITWGQVVGLHQDSAGYFYASRYYSDGNGTYYQVVRFKEGDEYPTPIITNTIGSGPNQIGSSGDNFITNDGNIYLLDPGNFRVQQYTLSSINTAITSRAAGNYSTEAVFFNGCTVVSNSVTTVPAPIPLTTKAEICLGSSAVLSVSNNNVTWNPGGQTGSSVTVSPVVTTTYTVTDNSSHCASAITVYVDTLLTGAISGPQCPGSGDLSINSADPPLKADWKIKDSLVNTSYATYTTNAAVAVAGNNGLGGALNQLQYPRAICFDDQDNLYVADGWNARVMKWAPGATEGVVVAGGNGQGSAANQLNYPTGVCVDKQGNIYVADNSNYRVQKWAPGATAGVTVAGGNTYSQNLSFIQPWSIFIDDANNLYVSDIAMDRVTKWGPSDTAGVIVAGGNGDGDAPNQLKFADDLFVDAAGNVYVADYQNSRVQKWAPGATSGVTVVTGNGSGYDLGDNPWGITLDGEGNLYVVNGSYGFISRWAPGATSGTYLAGYCCNGTGALNSAAAIRIDKKGNLYAVGVSNNVVWKYPAKAPVYTAPVNAAYNAVLTSFAGCTSNTDTFHFAPIAGDTAIYGKNTWNVYAFNSGGSSAWITNYVGYYTDSALNFDTRNKWNENTSPSAAPGFRGCTVNADNHSWSAKRQGFSCGHYIIDIPMHDDGAQLFIDGEKVWEHMGCCDPHNSVWEGDLNDNSTVVFRGTDGGGASNGVITFTPAITSITANGSVNLCQGGSVTLTSNNPANNQWYKDGVALEGDTAQPYIATSTGSYAVAHILPSGCAVLSSAKMVTVSDQAPAGDPTLFGDTTWNVSVYNAGNGTLTGNAWLNNYSGFYTSNTLSFDTRNDWNALGRPSNAANYQGCPVDSDYHSWSAKRQGFPCGEYTINVINHDDAAQLYVDGQKVWEGDCCSPGYGAWQGLLDISSRVEFKATDATGASSGAIEIVLNLPSISLNGPDKICPGYAVDLTAPEGENYIWSTSETSKSIQVSQTGSYSVTYTGTNGCTQTISQQITVQPIPKPELYTYASDVCGQGQLSFYINNNWDYNLTYTINSDSVTNYGWGSFATPYAGSYVVTGTDALGCSTEPSDPLVITEAPGNPDDFGDNAWNVYAWDNGANYGYNEPWKHYITDTNYNNNTFNAYRGYYADTTLSFNTLDKWTPDGVPGDAPNFQGCGLPYFNGWIFSWSAKRKGFPCGNYKISIPAHDDEAQLIINGVQVWEHGGCCDNHDSVWQGALGSNSTVEFRVNNSGGGACQGAISFALINTTAQTIWYADADNDGYGNAAVSIQDCAQPANYVANHTDCDDAHQSVHPGAPEICGNGIDDNCNGKVDEGCGGSPITITINDKYVIEGNKGQRTMNFILKLSKKPKQTVQVNYTTYDGTATAGSDYIAKSGTVIFAAGVKRQKIIITVNKDKIAEPDETFNVVLSNPVNAVIVDGSATGTIINDDGSTVKGQTIPVAAKTGINTLVQLMPNPAINRVNVIMKGYNGVVTINVMSLKGELLLQKKVQGTTVKYIQEPLDISRLASGVYMVIVIDGQGRRKTEKLIVQH